MKKIAAILALPLLLSLAGCDKCIIAPGTPECIKNKIETGKDSDNWYYSSVEEYRFQDKLVYAFNPDNKIIADGATMILTADCSSLCSVGGFGGPTINLCNGENFYQNAVLVRVIWDKYK